MNSNESISHEGVVTKSAEDGIVEVTITANSACSGCHAKSACGMGGSEQKIIQVKTSKNYNIGETVTVIMKQSLGVRAVMIGYFIPFAIMITVFILLTIAETGELFSALASFSSVGLYYVIVWLLRDIINKKFTFNIKD